VGGGGGGAGGGGGGRRIVHVDIFRDYRPRQLPPGSG